MTDLADIKVFCPLTRYPEWLLPRRFPYYRTNLAHAVPDFPTEYFEYPAIPVASRPFNPAMCKHFLLERVAAFRPDVILNFFVYPEGCAAVSVGEILEKPVVLGVIGSDVNRIPDFVAKWHTQRALRRASSVVTVSRQLTSRAVALGADPERTKTIPNGCDTSIFRPRDAEQVRDRLGIPRHAKLVVFVGWLAPTKGVRELLTAANELARKNPALRIAFIGEGALASEIRSLGESGDLAGRIFAPGVLPSSEVALWMAAADVFCLPSYAEGCPNVVLEAMACGRPVVASHVGAIPELIDRESGILTPPRDPHALAQALERALNVEWNTTQIALRSNRSWRTVAEETWAVCEQALQEGPHGATTIAIIR
jgi:glycosyltransferase involved in cell wall biosynthesis